MIDSITGLDINVKTQNPNLKQPTNDPLKAFEEATGVRGSAEGQGSPVRGMSQSDYNQNISPFDVERGKLEQMRAINQPWHHEAGNAIMQTAGSILGESLTGFGVLGELAQGNKLALDSENVLMDIGKTITEGSREAFPIYQQDPGGFMLSSSEDFFQNIVSIGSTLALMAPSMGVTKGLSMLGKGASTLSRGSRVLTQLANKVPQLSKQSKWIAGGLTQATLSRQIESTMEASGIYEEMLAKGYSKEDALKAAEDVYNKNWVMLLQDIPQYLALGKVFNPITGKYVSSASKLTGLSKKLGVAGVIGSEGIEEAYQFVVGENAKYAIDYENGKVPFKSGDERFADYVQESDFWNSVTMGAIGGAVFQAVGDKLSTRADVAREQEYLKQRGVLNAELFKNMQELDNTGDIQKAKFGRKMANMAMTQSAINNDKFDQHVEQLEALANSTPEELAEQQEQYGIELSPQMIQEVVPQLIKDSKKYQTKYLKYLNKYDSSAASEMSFNDIQIEYFTEQKDKFIEQAEDLKRQIPNYNELSFYAQEEFRLKSYVKSLDTYQSEQATSILFDNNLSEVEKKNELTKLQDEVKQEKENTRQKIKELKDDRTSEEKQLDKEIKDSISIDNVDSVAGEYAKIKGSHKSAVRQINKLQKRNNYLTTPKAKRELDEKQANTKLENANTLRELEELEKELNEKGIDLSKKIKEKKQGLDEKIKEDVKKNVRDDEVELNRLIQQEEEDKKLQQQRKANKEKIKTVSQKVSERIEKRKREINANKNTIQYLEELLNETIDATHENQIKALNEKLKDLERVIRNYESISINSRTKRSQLLEKNKQEAIREQKRITEQIKRSFDIARDIHLRIRELQAETQQLEETVEDLTNRRDYYNNLLQNNNFKVFTVDEIQTERDRLNGRLNTVNSLIDQLRDLINKTLNYLSEIADTIDRFIRGINQIKDISPVSLENNNEIRELIDKQRRGDTSTEEDFLIEIHNDLKKDFEETSNKLDNALDHGEISQDTYEKHVAEKDRLMQAALRYQRNIRYLEDLVNTMTQAKEKNIPTRDVQKTVKQEVGEAVHEEPMRTNNNKVPEEATTDEPVNFTDEEELSPSTSESPFMAVASESENKTLFEWLQLPIDKTQFTPVFTHEPTEKYPNSIAVTFRDKDGNTVTHNGNDVKAFLYDKGTKSNDYKLSEWYENFRQRIIGFGKAEGEIEGQSHLPINKPEIIEENNIVEVFGEDAKFVYINELGYFVDLNGKRKRIGRKFSSAKKMAGQIYTIVQDNTGMDVPIKLNTAKLNRDQAEIIWEAYRDVLESDDTKIMDKPISDELKERLEYDNKIYTSKKNITYGDLLDHFVFTGTSTHNYPSNRLYLWKGQVKYGAVDSSNITGDPVKDKNLPANVLTKDNILNAKEDFINFLTENKRHNIKVKRLKDRDYFEYITSNKYLNTEHTAGNVFEEPRREGKGGKPGNLGTIFFTDKLISEKEEKDLTSEEENTILESLTFTDINDIFPDIDVQPSSETESFNDKSENISKGTQIEFPDLPNQDVSEPNPLDMFGNMDQPNKKHC